MLIGFLIIGFPFIMGGREAWGHNVLITSSLLLGCVWSLHQMQTKDRFVMTGGEFLVVGAFLLLWVQTTPVGSEMLNRVSPEYGRLTESWGVTQQTSPEAAASATWATPSLMPHETAHALWILLAYTIVGVVAAQRVRREHDAERILKLVAVSGVTMAVFAAAQFVFSNDRFFWFYRNPFTGTDEVIKGAFTNRNHFAQFLTLSIGPLLWWMAMLRRPQRDRNGLGPAYSASESLFDRFMSAPILLLICALGCVLLCIMLSLSRGGMIAAGVATVVAVAGLIRSGRLGASAPFVVLLLGVLSIGGLMVFGSQKVESRVNQLASGDADDIDQMSCRRAIWAADIDAIRRFPILGTGVGSHREVYPTYMKDLADFSTFEFTHAESTYIHLALETGLSGLILLVLGLLLFSGRMAFAMFRSRSGYRRDCIAAAAAALAAGTLHAVADFIWYVPAIVIVTLILCVTGFRAASGFSERRGIHVPRPAWLLLSVACVFGIVQSQPDLSRRIEGEHWWYRYLTASFDFANSVASMDDAEDASDSAEQTDPTTDFGGYNSRSESHEVVAGYEASPVPEDNEAEIRSVKQRIGYLIRSIRANPHFPRAQVRMAALCLKLFDLTQQQAENPMALAEIRDTVRGVGFGSTDELHGWLNRAFGRPVRLPILADKLARRALQQCPVQGNAYMSLIETGFLTDPSDSHLQDHLGQLLTLRGYDPRARFVAGQIALLESNQAEAMKHWSVVFHANRQFRESITVILAQAVPAPVLLTEFQPTTTELPEVLAAYARTGRQREIEQILFEIGRVTNLEADTASSDDRIAVLMAGYETAWSMQLRETAEDMLRRAIACDESAYWPRHALGLLLFELERFHEAGDLFTWCYEQRPGDTQLERLVRESRRQALSQDVPVMNASFRTSQPDPISTIGNAENLRQER